MSNKQWACAGTDKVSDDNVEDSTDNSSLVWISNVTSNTLDPVCGGESKNIDSPRKDHIGSSITFKPINEQNVKQIQTSLTEDCNARIISNMNTGSFETVKENPTDMNISSIDMSVFDSQMDMFDSQTTTEETVTKSQVTSDLSFSQSGQNGFSSQLNIVTPLLQFNTSQPQVSCSGSDMSFVVAENHFLHSSCQNEAMSHRSVDSQVDLLNEDAGVKIPASLADNNLVDDIDDNDDNDSFVSVSTIPPQQAIISSIPNVIGMSSCRPQLDNQNIQMPACAPTEHEQNNKKSHATQNHTQITASPSVKSLSQVQMSSGDLMEISFCEEVLRKHSENLCVGKHSDDMNTELCKVLPSSCQSPLISLPPFVAMSADVRGQRMGKGNCEEIEDGLDEVMDKLISSQETQASSCFIVTKSDSGSVKIVSNGKGSVSKCCHVMDGNIIEIGNIEVERCHGNSLEKSCVISDKTNMCNDNRSKQTSNVGGDKTEEYSQPLTCDIHKVGGGGLKAFGSLRNKVIEGSSQTSWPSQSTVVSSFPSSQCPSLGNPVRTRNKNRLEIHAQELQSLDRLMGLYDSMLQKLVCGLISDGKTQLRKFEQILSKLNKKQEDEKEKLLLSKEKHSKSANMKLRMRQLQERQAMLQTARQKHIMLEEKILAHGSKAGSEKMLIRRKAAVNPAYHQETGELNIDVQLTREISSEFGTASQKSHCSISSQAISTAPFSPSKSKHEPPQQIALSLPEGGLDLEKPAQTELFKGTGPRKCLQIVTLHEDPNSVFPLSATDYTPNFVSSAKPVVINNAVNAATLIMPDTTVSSTEAVINVNSVSAVNSTKPVMINKTVNAALHFVPDNPVSSTRPVMIINTRSTARHIVPDNSVNSIKPAVYSKPVSSIGFCKTNNTDNSPSRFRPNTDGSMLKPSHPSSPCSTVSSSLFPVSSKELLRRMDLQLAAEKQSNQTIESLHTCQAQTHLNLPNVTHSQASNACMKTVKSIPLCHEKAQIQYMDTSATTNHNLSSTQESLQADYTNSTYRHSVSSIPAFVKPTIVSQMQTCLKPIGQNGSRTVQSCSLPLPAAMNVNSMISKRVPDVSISVSFPSPLCSVGHTYGVGPSSAMVAQSQCKRKSHEKIQEISEKKKRGRPRRRTEEAQSKKKNILNRSGKNHNDSSTSHGQIENPLPGIEIPASHKIDSSDLNTHEYSNLNDSDNHMLQVESTQNESNTKENSISKKSSLESMLSNGELDIAKLVDNLHAVELISDRELNITDFDEEFWEEDFAEIVMSQVFWSTVDMW